MKKSSLYLLASIALVLFLSLIFFGCHSPEDVSPSTTDMAYVSNGSRGFSMDMEGMPPPNGDKYNDFEENPFISTRDEATSTFSVDADGGSYANTRRFLNENTIPPKGAIRTEEIINYFNLDYAENGNSHPISLNGEISSCPWNSGNRLIRIGIKGKSISESELPPSNLVFLIDVSGSMSSPDKLQLLKEGFTLFVDELQSDDMISIVTYAGSSGVVLQPTPGDQKNIIKDAIVSLGSGGSTAGAQGIITAYELAAENLIVNGNNRIILGTDGDFNVGPSSQEELIDLIEEKRDSGIFLTVIGVGRGNLNDGMLEQLANNGNGTYEYIDNLSQAQKVFIYEYAKFYTVAKDVKVQVNFNPAMVDQYRLIGYENRLLENEDFEDDKKDAGEIGAGQNITALYEIIPKTNPNAHLAPAFIIEFRYKLPDYDVSTPISMEVFDNGTAFEDSSDFMKFTASLAGFGMLLRDSDYIGDWSYDNVSYWCKQAYINDPYGLKLEFEELVEVAKGL